MQSCRRSHLRWCRSWLRTCCSPGVSSGDSPRAHSNSQEGGWRMRVAIVGTGLMGGVHAEAWSHTGARIAAFVGTAGAGGGALAGTIRGRLVTDLDAVLA